MKTPQRNFVVEFKSGRRRPAIRPGSIWNDTDLKAIARETEAQAPHLFEPRPSPEASTGDIPTSSEPQTEFDARSGTDDGKAVPAEAEQTDLHQGRAHSTIIDVAHSAVLSLDQRTKTRANRLPNANSDQHSDDRDAMSVPRLGDSKIEPRVDDLTSLQEENQRLKVLLKRHLRQQNLQLEKMLERFGTI